MTVQDVWIREMLRREQRDVLPQRSKVGKEVDEDEDEESAACGNSVYLDDIHQ